MQEKENIKEKQKERKSEGKKKRLKIDKLCFFVTSNSFYLF